MMREQKKEKQRITLMKLDLQIQHRINLGSPPWELRTASPRGRYGERPQRDSCLKIHM